MSSLEGQAPLSTRFVRPTLIGRKALRTLKFGRLAKHRGPERKHEHTTLPDICFQSCRKDDAQKWLLDRQISANTYREKEEHYSFGHSAFGRA